MANQKLTRREFVRDSAVAAAGIAAAVGAAQAAATDTSKILNYNPAMEYHRAGKTGLMVSAVAMGGHWKRIEKQLPAGSSGKAILG